MWPLTATPVLLTSVIVYSQLTVNFPMPPALQMLRNMLLRKVAEGDDSDSSDEGDKEGERGKPDGGVSGGEKAKPLKKGKKKSKRKPG